MTNHISRRSFIGGSDARTIMGDDEPALLREIKLRQPNMPVMMVTAYGDDERRRLAEGWGAAEFITKPVDFELLKAQLRQLPNAAD
jgi:DNA-binding NtrC family response regulator